MTTNQTRNGLPLLDGREKITGALKYSADLTMPGLLFARLVLSPYAHARIQHIDTAPALACAGVVAVLTSADMPDFPPGDRAQLLLARGRVVFVGQPVALVLGETEAAAEDGATALQIDYDPLPAAVTLDDALAADAPLVWGDDLPADFDSFTRTSNHRAGEITTRGDVAQGFAESDLIVERVFTSPMVHQSSLETHTILAQPEPARSGMTLWAATQDPFGVRLAVADILNVPETNVRVIGMALGGGFGGKFPIYEPLVALAAQHVQRPVMLALTRSEELLATNPAPAMRVHAKLGAKRDGTLTALEATVYLDDGCLPNWLANFARWQLGNLFRIPHLHITGVEVLTFKPSVGSYRAPTAPTVVFALDTMVDEIAVTLALDPFTVKRHNLMVAGDRFSDADTSQRKLIQGGGALEVFDALEQHPIWQNREQIRATTGHGVGMAMAVWHAPVQPGSALCNLQRDGKLVVNVGIADVSGVNTSFALLAAETFGVAPEDVVVVRNDTSGAALSGMSAGSMSLYNTGGAVLEAAKAARQQVLEIAAHEFEAAIEDIDIVNGKVQVRGVPDKAIPLAQIARQTLHSGSLHAPVTAAGRYTVQTGEPVYCGQLAEVEVDPETGKAHVVNLVVVQDAGRAINPPMVHGQMAGGATQGIGWALYEGMIYDEGGQLLTGSWVDYTVPSIMQTAPKIETHIVEVPSQMGPLGARGVGEAPVIATAAAVANAIAHATGARLTDLPMTPVRVWEAMQGNGAE